MKTPHKFKNLITKEATIFLFRKLWHFSEQKPKIILFIAMLIAGNCTLLLTPIIIGSLISEIQQNNVSMSNYPYLLAILLCLPLKDLFFWILHGPARVIERMVAFEAEINYRKFLMKNILFMNLEWHTKKDSGDSIDKINRACTGLLEFGQNIYQIIQTGVKLIGTSIVLLLYFSPYIGLGCLLLVIAVLAITFQFDRMLIPQYASLNQKANDISGATFDALSNIFTVKTLQVENRLHRKLGLLFRTPYNVFKKNAIINEFKWFTGNMGFQFICVLPIAGFLYFSAQSGAIVDSGEISALYLYLSDLIFIFFSFGGFYEQFIIFQNRIKSASALENLDSSSFLKNNHIQERRIDSIETRALSFRYHHKTHPILNGISLSFKRGEKIALIGESGSGKTTLLKILHGMYAFTQGQIVLNNQHVFSANDNFSIASMLVPQEAEIFSASLIENLTLGVPFKDEEIKQVINDTELTNLVNSWTQGYQEELHEKGANLSGGQKQRIALARALLFSKGKNLLLLDESTSNIDAKTEEKIYQNIFKRYPETTIIASIHKLHLLPIFNKVIALENGCLVA